MSQDSACPACGTPDPIELFERGDRAFRTTEKMFQLSRCRRCDVVFLSPPPPPSELAAYYPAGYWTGPPGDGAREARGLRAVLAELYRRIVLFDHLRFVRRIAREQRARGLDVRVLDVGCGDGLFLEALGEEKSVAMDYSLDAVACARARGIPAVRGTLLDRPFRDRSFTLLAMFHVLEHVAPPAPYLEAARALLDQGGELVVQVPNTSSFQARLAGRRWFGLEIPRHLVNYSDRSLRETLERNGFEIVRQTHFSLRDNAATLANTLFPGLFPPARVARGGARDGIAAWAADLAYLGLCGLCLPFTTLESACGRGAAVMVQARPVSGN